MPDRISNLLWAIAWISITCCAYAAPPRVFEAGYHLELVASEPDIVTPIGMAFDRHGRLLVVESHTHERPEDYDGPARDRVRMLADSDGDGNLDRWSTFAEGYRHAMNLLVRDDGGVYLVTRGQLILLRDTDDDGVADREDLILRLETDDDYPHNALGGIDQAPDGSLVIGLGENHGDPFRLIGADGKVIEGTGGLDGFFRCSAEGTSVAHIARGVWNPFSLCVVPDGRIFAVDNDPDSSPPCRLLHVVEGGDYGYLYQYGRAGTHPLQCWNGELPGTLPMVCGVGEAPTAIVAHGAWLWVTSWGDHRIDRYRLAPRGASYSAEREVIVQGDTDFRPAGMAVAPDGSLYFGDWVKRDYPVHRKGRIWRLRLPSEDLETRLPPLSETVRGPTDVDEASIELATSQDPFARVQLVWHLAGRDAGDPVIGLDSTKFPILQAERLRGDEDSQYREVLLRAALQDDQPDVRLFAVRWIADERITALRDDVARLLEGPQPDSRYYLAVLAAIDWLDHKPKMRKRGIADSLLVRELKNMNRSPSAYTLALQSLSPENEFLTLARLRKYLKADYPPLRLEAVRSLAQHRDERRLELLAAIARDAGQSDDVRAEAIIGLAAAAERYRGLLEQFASCDSRMLSGEAERVLRLTKQRPAANEPKPPASELAAWHALLQEPGDAAAGRRLFFSSVGARCGVCHEHSGRGGRIGPDLTHVGRSTSRERIIDSILQPSREVAPHYQPWLLTTTEGRTLVGLRLAEGGDDGTEEYADTAGERFTLKSRDIESREVASTSIMPDGLESTVSIADLRDLITFLTADAVSYSSSK